MKMKLENAAEIESFYRGHLAYEKHATGSSIKIIAGKQRFYFSDGEKFHALQFQLLRKIKATGEAYRGGGGQVKFYDVNPAAFQTGGGQFDGYEMDLNRAYITAADSLKVFPRGVIAALKRQPKEYRLKLLGSLATRKSIFIYDTKGRLTGQREEYSRRGVELWRRICATVGNDLAHVARYDKGFVAFWVDNYFTTNKNAAADLRARGYAVKVKRRCFEFQLEAHGTRFVVDGCRPFYLPRHNSYTASRLSRLSAGGNNLLDAQAARVDYLTS